VGEAWECSNRARWFDVQQGKGVYCDLVCRLQKLIGWILGNDLECFLRLLSPFFIVFNLKKHVRCHTLCVYREACTILWVSFVESA